MPKAVDEYEAILDRNPIWLERTKGVGLLSAEDAIALGPVRARCCARPASTGTCAGASRTSPTTRSTSTCPSTTDGDVYDRYRVRMDEMRESMRIVAQCLDRLEEMQGEPWIADDRKVVLPPREELHTSMESLIHHFKIVTEGYRVPEGEVYVGDRVAARRDRAATSSRTAARSRGA